MSADYSLNATLRNDMGKGASRRLRRAAQVPAILYGGDQTPTSITLTHKDVMKSLENEGFYSHILTINVDGKAERAVLKDVQRHPYKPIVMHMDLQRILENEEIRVHVPLHFVGEDVAPGVKLGHGIVNHLMNSVDVECLPKDLPEFIEVDMSPLQVGESVHLSELKLPAGVVIPELAQGPEHDLPVASIVLPRAAVEVEEAAPAVEEAPEGGAEAAE